MVPLHVLIIDDDPRACAHLREQLTHVAPEARVLAELHSFAAAEKRPAFRHVHALGGHAAERGDTPTSQIKWS